MYDKKLKKWTASSAPSNIFYRPGNEMTAQEALRSRFEEADRALAAAENGSKNIDAVYMMESAAKAGSADACLAMGQLFEYGWAVAKNKKQAYIWYERAARAGSAEAAEILSRRKKQRANKIALIAIAAFLAAAIAAFCVVFLPGMLSRSNSGNNAPSLNVVLPGGVEYREIGDINEHSAAIRDLMNRYDTDEIKSGKVHANRILLVYKGDKLDLSGYGVVGAVGDKDYIILQFENAEDAERCMNYLNTLEGTVAAQYGRYNTDAISSPSVSAGAGKSNAPEYHSPINGLDYWSWGAGMMNFDKYSVYLQKILPEDHKITVAVIDTGTQPWPETEARILDGFDFNGLDPAGHHDYNGHGTHVAGTILDCTQGVNVNILPCAVTDPTSEDCRGMTAEAIIEALRFSIDKKAEVINMSLGGPYLGTQEDDLEEYWVNQAIDEGIVVCVAAGNESINAGGRSPARVERCITVAGIDKYQASYVNTNYGSVVDVCAPAVEILSNYHLADDVCYKTGTSMACPHISAMAAMMQLEFHESPDVISFYMRSYTQQIGSDPDYFGAGLPDGSLILE